MNLIRFIYKSLNNDDLLTFRRNDYFNKVAHIYGWSHARYTWAIHNVIIQTHERTDAM